MAELINAMDVLDVIDDLELNYPEDFACLGEYRGRCFFVGLGVSIGRFADVGDLNRALHDAGLTDLALSHDHSDSLGLGHLIAWDHKRFTLDSLAAVDRIVMQREEDAA